MSLSSFQRELCRLLADHRRASGESYVAGGVALNEALGANRLSNDIDLFHDSRQALAQTWDLDRELLRSRGYGLEVVRERPTFVEARVGRGPHRTTLQWSQDSAFRFFPLVAHDDFGLTLHPFDLATNKVLALVGRLEVRDWIDVIESNDGIQGLGYLAWAACGKDPGFNPASILEQAGRSVRYSEVEVAELAFEGRAPRAADLSRRWHRLIVEAREIVARLPPVEVGKCVVDLSGGLCRLTPEALSESLLRSEIQFHSGSIGGVLPVIVLDE